MPPRPTRRDLPPGVQPGMFEDGSARLPAGAMGSNSATGAGRAPLAARMRPRDLDEFVGQSALVGPGGPLRRMVERDEVRSLVLWGPPGSGKTTLAAVISRRTRRHFEPLSAVESGVAEIRRAVADARDRRRVSGVETILFIDEIHRFNRAQQDVVLPYVEDGTITLIGATTENPSFYVVAPLLSRARVFKLELLTALHIADILRRALSDTEHGLGGEPITVAPEAIDTIAELAGGDARAALNLLEFAVDGTAPDAAGVRHVQRAAVEDSAQHPTLLYDRMGDAHYDTISAFIKSVRDSDPDGALYWLARMLEAGEDPLFVARRLVVLASEDIGLADPRALPLAMAAQQATHFLGMPEARLPLAETTVYLARAPKSNSAYAAYERARADVERTRNAPVPLHLRNAPTGLMRSMGYGQGYEYAHNFEDHRPPPSQTHRPPEAEGNTYYVHGTLGDEACTDQTR